MGNPDIWLWVAVAFGLVCGTTYTLIQRKDKPQKLKLWLISSAVYFIAGYAIYRLLNILLG